MNSNQKLSYAIAAILSAQAAGAYSASAADTGSSATSSSEIQEITVTATRRSESAQNVPITLQALTAETLTQLNVTTFSDYVKYLPNVTASSSLPGIGQIYMRGLATTQDGPQSSGTTGAFPNVAVYLDDQSAQLPGRNLDIYAADLERIEVLEGPQGTLFGAGAQAGVVRYITNKPKLNVTEANFNAGFGTTAHGANSSNVDATINIPLIDNKLAIRGVIYNENRGGYIDNLPTKFTRRNTDAGTIRYLGGVVPPGSEVVSNDRVVANDINPVTYKGIRVSGLYQFNDDWNLLVAQSYQSLQADGVFSQTSVGTEGQPLPELSINLFNPTTSKDRFTNTAWTVNGRFGDLKAVYTGGYLARNVNQVADYTNYARGVYGDYYQCIIPGSAQAISLGIPQGKCFSPSSTFQVIQRNTHQSHEFRLSTPDDGRIRAIGGLFWEDYKIYNQSDWYYRDAQAGFIPLQPSPLATTNNPNPRAPEDAFYNDTQRGYKQKAAFTSIDFEIIPKVLTITAGTRYYIIDEFQVGLNQGSFGCRTGSLPPGTTTCIGGNVLDNKPIPPNNEAFVDGTSGLKKQYKGFKSRVNLSWKVTDDALLYFTWSQGFRPGGFNRVGGGAPPLSSPLRDVYTTPVGFKPDILTNKEIGWKTQWFDHRLQFNGAIYQEDWKDVQVSVFAPGVLQNTTFSTNGPDYRVKGGETDIVWRATTALTLSVSASYNKSELVKEVSFNKADGTPIDLVALGFRNPFGLKGDPLALSPKFQGSFRARYDFNIGDYNAFTQLAGSYHGKSFASTDRLVNDLDGNSVAYELPSYSTFDFSVGVAKGPWNAQIYATNVTDKRAITFSSYTQWIKQDTVIRPRTISLNFGYKFGGQ